MLQIVFIVQTDFVVVVTKIKEAYADISKTNVASSQNSSVDIVKNSCSGIVRYKNIKLNVPQNMLFEIIVIYYFYL